MDDVDGVSLHSENSGVERGKEVSEDEDVELGWPPLKSTPTEGDYVLAELKVKVANKLRPDCDEFKYYVGKIIKDVDEDGDLEISYLRVSANTINSFVMPNVPDMNSIPLCDVKAILPRPGEQKVKRLSHRKIRYFLFCCLSQFQSSYCLSKR